MVTIKEIAIHAGVGTGTVSRVINGNSNVSKDTKTKVLKAIKELNYQPNKAARALAKRNYKQNTIGIVSPIVIHPFFNEILKGIYWGLAKSDYNLLIFNKNKPNYNVIEHILDESLPGIIFLTEGIDTEAKKLLKLSNIKFIFVDLFDKNENSLYFDNKKGGTLIAEHIIKQKYKKIAYIGDKTPCIQQSTRLSEIKQVLAQHQLSIEKEVYIKYSETESYKATRELLTEKNYDTIIYFCDDLAYGGHLAVKELNSNVELIGYDDLPLSKYLSLSTVKQPAEKVGHDAIKLLLKKIANRDDKKTIKKYSPKLIIRP